MGISSGSGRGGIFTEINITPLTDIFLVLLIIMMVIAPRFQNMNDEIEVPEINSGQSVEDVGVTLEVVKEGEYYLDNQKIAEENLANALRTAVATTGSKEKLLVVRADKAAKSHIVITVFEAASEAGFEKLTIAGEPLSAKRKTELRSSSSQPGHRTPPWEER